ncbi:hypothetical protein L198_04207 [Cryptococcus wingfieldii CBS 7118]|uniref:Uncharacterized protein n=1 Tax=Cryptococcus wingfieldii CBS 7118 TaxID=1295528 RepID=A0A1E3J6J8_9TREE|nr:hypothetical protein L198_04207 [Cryptococcus wingfieldii CBS 7118]ODN96493.1 hypothetical protein L198_04207 [Cryptococcus wingfieldii CBS 7118]
MAQLNEAVTRLRNQAREVAAQRGGGTGTPGVREGARVDDQGSRTGNVTIQLTEPPPFVLPSHIQSFISQHSLPPLTPGPQPSSDPEAWEVRAQTVENRIQRLSQAARVLRDRAQAQGERRQRMIDRPLRSDRPPQSNDSLAPWRRATDAADAQVQRLLEPSDHFLRRRDRETMVDGIRDMEGLNSNIGSELEGIAGQIHGLLLGNASGAGSETATGRCQRRASRSHIRRHENQQPLRSSRSRGCAPTNTRQVSRQPPPQVICTPHTAVAEPAPDITPELTPASQPTPVPAMGNTAAFLGHPAPAQARPSSRTPHFNLPSLREALGLEEHSPWAFGSEPDPEDDEGTVRGTPPPGGRVRIEQLEESIHRIENSAETSGGTYRSLVNGTLRPSSRPDGAAIEESGSSLSPQSNGREGAGSGTLRGVAARLRESADRQTAISRTPGLDAARAQTASLQPFPGANPPNERMEVAVELGPVVFIGDGDREGDWSDDSLDDLFEGLDPTAAFGDIGDVLAAGSPGGESGHNGGRSERTAQQEGMTFRGRRVADRIAASSAPSPAPSTPFSDPIVRHLPRWDYPADDYPWFRPRRPRSFRSGDTLSSDVRPIAREALGPNFLGGPVGRWRLAPLQNTREEDSATTGLTEGPSPVTPSRGTTLGPASSAGTSSAPNSTRHEEMMARIRHAREALRNIRGLREDMGTQRRGPPVPMPEVMHRESAVRQVREEAVAPHARSEGIQPVRGEITSEPDGEASAEVSTAQQGSSSTQAGSSRSAYMVCDREDSDFGIQQWPTFDRL